MKHLFVLYRGEAVVVKTKCNSKMPTQSCCIALLSSWGSKNKYCQHIFIKPRSRTNANAFILASQGCHSWNHIPIEFHLAPPDTFLDWVPSYHFSLPRVSQYHQPFRLDLFSGYISLQDFPHDLLKTWQSSTCKRMNNFSLLHYLCEIARNILSCTKLT